MEIERGYAEDFLWRKICKLKLHDSGQNQLFQLLNTLIPIHIIVKLIVINHFIEYNIFFFGGSVMLFPEMLIFFKWKVIRFFKEILLINKIVGCCVVKNLKKKIFKVKKLIKSRRSLFCEWDTPRFFYSILWWDNESSWMDYLRKMHAFIQEFFLSSFLQTVKAQTTLK